MPVTELKSYEEYRTAITGDKVAVIDFWATWCGPCRVIGPVFEKFSDALGDKINFYKVDVDAQEQIAAECGIRAMPTFIFFKDGTPVETVTGANPAALDNALKKHAA